MYSTKKKVEIKWCQAKMPSLVRNIRESSTKSTKLCINCLCLHTLYLEKVFKNFPKIDVLCVMQSL